MDQKAASSTESEFSWSQQALWLEQQHIAESYWQLIKFDGAAIVASMALAGQLSGRAAGTIHCVIVLGASWLFLMVSILAARIRNRLYFKANFKGALGEDQMERATDLLAKSVETEGVAKIVRRNSAQSHEDAARHFFAESNKIRGPYEKLEWIAEGTAAVGCIFIAVFAGVNLNL